MTHQTRIPAIVLLVALTLCVGVPPSLIAHERPQNVVNVPGGGPGQPPCPPQQTGDNGDPDDWASRGSDGDDSVGPPPDETAGSLDEWLNYLESISELLASIRLNLLGIL